MKHVDMTRHAAIRRQQRAIPPLVIEWLLDYGRREKSAGADLVRFDRRARKNLARDVGSQAVAHLAKYLNAALVIDPTSDAVITVQWLR